MDIDNQQSSSPFAESNESSGSEENSMKDSDLTRFSQFRVGIRRVDSESDEEIDCLPQEQQTSGQILVIIYIILIFSIGIAINLEISLLLCFHSLLLIRFVKQCFTYAIVREIVRKN